MPSQWITRGAAQGEKKGREEEVEEENDDDEEETVVEAKAKRATAITGDGKSGEKMMVASTRRVTQACVYIYIYYIYTHA